MSKHGAQSIHNKGDMTMNNHFTSTSDTRVPFLVCWYNEDDYGMLSNSTSVVLAETKEEAKQKVLQHMAKKDRTTIAKTEADLKIRYDKFKIRRIKSDILFSAVSIF